MRDKLRDNSIKKNTGTYLVLAGSIFFSKLIGMFRDILIANFYGVGADAVSFAAASKIPLILFDVSLGSAVAGAFIPMLNTFLAKDDTDGARDFASKFTGAVIALAGFISILGTLFPSMFIYAIAPGLNGAEFEKACSLLSYMSPITLIAALSYTFVAVLQSIDRFIAPALISVLSNLAVIAYFFTLNSSYGVRGLACALTLGWVLQLALTLVSLKKSGFKPKVSFKLKDEHLKNTVILTLPVLASTWVTPINTFVTTNFASSISGGAAIPMLDYAYKLYFVAAGVFSFALTNLFFPRLSRYFSLGDTDGATDTLKSMLSGISYIILPISALLIALARPIIRIVYMRGQFDLNAAESISALLAIYSAGMLSISFQEILNKYFYSMKNTRIPLYAALCGIVTNLTAGYIFAKIWGVRGLAAATALSSAVMALILLAAAIAKDRRIADPRVACRICGYAIACIASYFAAKYVSGLFANDLISVAAGGAAGVFIYFCAVVALRIKKFGQLFEV